MSKKLLLADDSITIQKVIGITFANEDFDLTIVDNGDAALQKARDERPDLILADIFMPGKDGYELCTAVKQDPSLQGVPVLLLTGTFEPFDEDKARNAGADSWIAKPFESQALIGRVEELLDSAPVAPAESEAPAAPREVTPENAPAAAAAPSSDGWENTFEFEEEGGDEDLWGAVSLDEEELGEPVPETPVSRDEQEFVFEEDPFASREETTFEEHSKPAPPEDGEDFAFEDEPFGLGEESVEGFAAPEEGKGNFGFKEEPLSSGEDPLVEAPDPEPDIFGDDMQGEEEFVLGEEKPAGAVESAAPASVEEASDDDILTLDDVDILEEEELEPISGDAAGEPPREAVPAGPSDVEAPAAEEDIWGDAAVGQAQPAREDDYSLTEEGPEWGKSETEEVVPPPAAFDAGPTAAAEEKVRALSDEELTEVVERVAGEVVERLASTILEKIAWEVVPDLAESLIKDEIRKIKEGAA